MKVKIANQTALINFVCLFIIFKNKYLHFRFLTIGIITNYQPISLQVSDRVTHQLFSRVYAIFLKEYLNFSNVTFTDEEYPSDNQETQIFWTQHNLLQLK